MMLGITRREDFVLFPRTRPHVPSDHSELVYVIMLLKKTIVIVVNVSTLDDEH